jgi:hypothetical protein
LVTTLPKNTALGFQVDTTAPLVTSVAPTPTANAITITLSLNEAVTVTGKPVLLLNNGGTATFDTSASKKTSLVFTYAPPANQGTASLQVIGIQLPSPNAITDSAGNRADLSKAAANLGIKVAGGTSGSPDVTVTGKSVVEIFGASSQNVSFATGATGTLKLDAPTAFSGKVSGMATGDAIDLANLLYDTKTTTLGYSGTAAGGTLSVTNGAQTDMIALIGNYAAASFTLASDGHGGTSILDTANTIKIAAMPFAVPHI